MASDRFSDLMQQLEELATGPLVNQSRTEKAEGLLKQYGYTLATAVQALAQTDQPWLQQKAKAIGVTPELLMAAQRMVGLYKVVTVGEFLRRLQDAQQAADLIRQGHKPYTDEWGILRWLPPATS